jgi:hypothetical protein
MFGETATVTDKVDGVDQSARGHIFLNMGGKYPNQAFTAFIPAASAGLFSRGRNSTKGERLLFPGRSFCIR